MTNVGKLRYQEIPIPENLEQVIWSAIRQEERREDQPRRRTRRTADLRRWLVAAAAVFAVLFACANIQPIYARAAELPVLGRIVRVLHVGSGGEITDGARASAKQAAPETVKIAFESASENMSFTPSYKVLHRAAPERMVLTLSGVRGVDFDSVKKSLLAGKAVQDVYPEMIPDDSSMGMVIVLNDGWDYRVTEYAKPGALELKFFRTGGSTGKTVWYLRTDSMPYGEEVSSYCEMVFPENPTQLKAQNGNYLVTVGEYDSRAAAEKALKDLQKQYGDVGFRVAKGTAGEIPKK
jgi:hypothetical protein